MNGRTYWRSLAQLAGTPAYGEAGAREFPEGATDAPGPFSRRRFLQIMSASVALAGFSGCRWPKEEIVPYAHRPEGTTPGEPLRFATAIEVGGVVRPLVVTSYDGRPVKIEGNEKDPIGRGATSAQDQACILDLYDPDRSRSIVRREGSQEITTGWDEFFEWAAKHFGELRARQGEGLCILSEPSSSTPLIGQTEILVGTLLREPRRKARWFLWDPLRPDGTGGMRVRNRSLDFDGAEVILSLDADLFGDHPEALRHTREFAEGRRGENGRANRLYVVESIPSITGSMADHRLPLPSGQMGAFVNALARELVLRQEIAAGDEVRRVLDEKGEVEGIPMEFVRVVAKDLAAHKGRATVATGPRQPQEVREAVEKINQMLESRTRTFSTPRSTWDSGRAGLKRLADHLNAGNVNTLIILGGNPAYDAPADLPFAELMGKAEQTIHLSTHRNETSRLSTWHIPRAHDLESWDVKYLRGGGLAATQPLIEPLYGGKTPAELLALVLDGRPRMAYDLARDAVRHHVRDEGFERFWRRFLHDGVRNSEQYLDNFEMVREFPVVPAGGGPKEDEIEIVFLPDSKVGDGRFANNGWLQELPDPITKLTWDNAALVGPATAEALGVQNEDVIRIERNGRSIEIAAYILPGVAPNTIGLPLGYGRTAAGRVGNGVGVDTYKIRTSDALWIAGGAEVARTGKRYPLACTQDHHAIDAVGARERERRTATLIREVEARAYAKDPEKAMRHGEGHHPPLVSLWKEHSYEGHAWGMAIDLNACTGCGACVVACQAENNIPIVGRKQVRARREMHWIRVDRYFRGDGENPEMVHQPVTCMQCENAPCEQVCPVAATVHTSEGLNAMVYNRCIGTRYCSNNCPYKVRRFNFFNYHKKLAPTEKMLFNPEVTVRSRGVMEKCTFCVQRIETAKIRAKNDRRPLADGEIVPACAQACPARAIVFGDRNDPESAVSRLLRAPRAYRLLEELNGKPRTGYLARLRNRNEDLEGKPDHEPSHT